MLRHSDPIFSRELDTQLIYHHLKILFLSHNFNHNNFRHTGQTIRLHLYIIVRMKLIPSTPGNYAFIQGLQTHCSEIKMSTAIKKTYDWHVILTFTLFLIDRLSLILWVSLGFLENKRNESSLLWLLAVSTCFLPCLFSLPTLTNFFLLGDCDRFVHYSKCSASVSLWRRLINLPKMANPRDA